jgi:hypothetical protein
MRFVDKKFNIGNNDCYGNIVVSLITVIREINGFNNILSSFKMFDVEFEFVVLDSLDIDIGWAAVTLAYDEPDGDACDA